MDWRGIGGLRSALLALLGGGITACVLAALAVWHRLQVVDHIERGTATLREAHRADDLARSASILLLVVGLAAGIVWIVWQWRVAKNVELFSDVSTRFSPSWSIWGWIIPLASLVIPVLVMQDLWRASVPGGSRSGNRRGSVLIGVWWAAFIIGTLPLRAIGNSDAASLADVRSSNQRALVGLILVMGTAVLAMFVVLQLSERLEALRAAPSSRLLAGSRPGPGWYADPMSRFEYRYWDGTQWTPRVSAHGHESFDPVNPTPYTTQFPSS